MECHRLESTVRLHISPTNLVDIHSQSVISPRGPIFSCLMVFGTSVYYVRGIAAGGTHFLNLVKLLSFSPHLLCYYCIEPFDSYNLDTSNPGLEYIRSTDLGKKHDVTTRFDVSSWLPLAARLCCRRGTLRVFGHAYMGTPTR